MYRIVLSLCFVLFTGCAAKKASTEEELRYKLSIEQRAAMDALEDEDFPESDLEDADEDILEGEEDE